MFLDEDINRELHLLAGKAGVPVSELVRDALQGYVSAKRRRQPFRLDFLAAGRSGVKNVSEIHEGLLWTEAQPHRARRSSKPRRTP